MDKTLNDPLDPISHDGLAAPITNKGTYDHPEIDKMHLTLVQRGSVGTVLVNALGKVVGVFKLVRKR